MTGARLADSLKRAAAIAAVAEIESGMLVGLGTGSTVAFAIEELGRRAAASLRITTVATSLATARAARTAGLRVVSFERLDRVDIAVDGADEIDGGLRAIKGGGGAMLREKIVATAASRMIAIIDCSKQVARLGARPVPVEVLPFALGFVGRRLTEMGANVSRRMTGDHYYATDQRNAVLDGRFARIDDPERLAAALSAIPGVLGHGLFIDEIDAAYIGGGNGPVCLTREGQ